MSCLKREKIKAYARAVQFPLCCKFDHRILFTALGIIQASATQAPKKLNSKSVTVATATPNETTTSVITYNPKRYIFLELFNIVINLKCCANNQIN
jgi:hypothetical protein